MLIFSCLWLLLCFLIPLWFFFLVLGLLLVLVLDLVVGLVVGLVLGLALGLGLVLVYHYTITVA